MCCDAPDEDVVPPAVAAMLAEYEKLLVARAQDWGGEMPADPGVPIGRYLGVMRLWMSVFGAGSWAASVRQAIPQPPPAGLIVCRITDEGVRVDGGPRQYVFGDVSVPVAILLDSNLDEATEVTIDGVARPVEPGGMAYAAALADVRHTALEIDGAQVAVADVVEGARVRLHARAPARWSVVDDRGAGWFPAGRLPKWDFHERPFVHGNDLVIDVPAVALRITCARGLEF